MRQEQLARLIVSLEAQTARYQRELEQSRAETRRWRRQVNSDVGLVKKAFIALVGVYSLNEAKAFYQEHADGIDVLAKRADKLGVTTEALQGLRHAGELTGVSVDKMDMAIQRQTRRVAEAAQGYGEAAGALKELNLDAKALVQLSPDQQFAEIAEAMGQVENQSDKVRLAMKLFDSGGVALVNTLALGKEGLESARAELDSYGVAISRVDASKIESSNDQMYRAGLIFKGIGQQIAIETGPLVGGLATAFLGAAQEAGGFGNITKRAINVMASGVGYAGNAVKGFQVIWLHLRLVITEVVASALSSLSTLAEKSGGILERFGYSGLSNFAEGARHWETVYSDAAEQVKSRIEAVNDELLNATPYEKVKQWVDDIVVKSERAAEEAAANSSGLQRLLLGDVGAEESDPAVAAEKTRAEKIEKIRAQSRKNIEHQELAFQAKILDFQEAATKSKVKTLLSEGVQITQGAAHTNKEMFQLNKVAALSEAAITLPSAVLKAVERGGGLPWGAAFGALTFANGLSKIRAIEQSSFGSGQSASLSGFGGGAVPVHNTVPSDLGDILNEQDAEGASEDRGQTHIYFYGDAYGFDDFSGKVEEAVTLASRNDRIVIRDRSGRAVIERS